MCALCRNNNFYCQCHQQYPISAASVRGPQVVRGAHVHVCVCVYVCVCVCVFTCVCVCVCVYV